MTESRRDAPNSPSACPLHSEAVPLYGDALRGDTHELWELMRKRFGGIAPVEVEPGVAAWLMLGYSEHLQVLRDQHLFSHDGRIWRELKEGRITPEAGTYPVFAHRPNALHSDGAEHQRLRGALVDSYDGSAQSRLRVDIEDLANALIDRFAARGEADLIAEYAGRIPLLAVNRMLGQDDRHGHYLCDLMVELWNGNGEAANAANEKMVGYLVDLVDRKRGEPGDDITSRLIAHPAGLTDEEVVQQVMLTIAAAHDPTANLIGNALRLLLTEQEMRMAVAGAQLRVDEAIDQVLWRDPPFQTLAGRYARRDTEVAGYRIREGDCLISGFAAANNDPLLFDGGGTHASARSSGNRAHLAWGVGPHRCPAQKIGHHMAAVSIETLVFRLSDMRLSVPERDLRWRPSLFIRGLERLPVVFTPQEVPDAASGDPTWPQSNPSSSTPAPETPKDRRPDSANSGLWSRLSSLVRSWRGL
ncbi:cytochrome P450 [Spinactinospora alkalitolerans]|uniref:Cytochrome P450 n=1 Tax=Spinactinospora alkalitolerans TaxID=687207 RepID=A0A852TYD8_9ACTN|nr:cytochrome P450 [Spinactinospora alkalitolerans]NYE48948.1 cytochrome P450 [Spinactinospora alkalitolerans]